MLSPIDKSVEKSVEESALLAQVRYDGRGLVPVVACAVPSGAVLMVAYMNEAALEETLRTRRVCYYSRSRRRLWRKGETSGHTQVLKAAYLDCDGDTLLLEVQQTGPACHTGAPSCFFRKIL